MSPGLQGGPSGRCRLGSEVLAAVPNACLAAVSRHSAPARTSPGARDEAGLPGAREGHLAELCEAVGLHPEESTSLSVAVRCATFEDSRVPHTMGVGPAGACVSALGEGARDALRDRCADLLSTPFEVVAGGMP